MYCDVHSHNSHEIPGTEGLPFTGVTMILKLTSGLLQTMIVVTKPSPTAYKGSPKPYHLNLILPLQVHLGL